MRLMPRNIIKYMMLFIDEKDTPLLLEGFHFIKRQKKSNR